MILHVCSVLLLAIFPVILSAEPVERGLFTERAVAKPGLDSIRVAKVDFHRTPMPEVLQNLGGLVSREVSKGLLEKHEFVFVESGKSVPTVTLCLRNLSLQKILNLICVQARCDWEVKNGVVLISPSSESELWMLRTDFFPLSKTALEQMGISESDALKEEKLQAIFEMIGIAFSANKGSSLALTKDQLIVTQTWHNQRRIKSLLTSLEGATAPAMPELSPLEQRLLQIKIKEFHCRGNSLPEALAMLTQLSLGDAPANSTGVPAVNLAAFGWGDKEAPSVNITLRDLSLGRMLEFVAEQVDYDVFSMDDVVVLKPKSEGVVPARLMTAFYPLTGPAFERLGLKGTPVENAEKLRRLFEDNGVVFEAVRGARLGLTANRLVVVQSARNHDRIARVLAEMK